MSGHSDACREEESGLGHAGRDSELSHASSWAYCELDLDIIRESHCQITRLRVDIGANKGLFGTTRVTLPV